MINSSAAVWAPTPKPSRRVGDVSVVRRARCWSCIAISSVRAIQRRASARRVGLADALGVGEPETARTELLSEDAILFLERVNDVTRLLVDPARDGHDEELKHLGKRRHTGRA